MGKGKGSVEYWVAQVRPGKVIFEISGVSFSLAKSAFLKCSSKLPIITRFVEK
jgi:large subunit ribosomal protein L16